MKTFEFLPLDHAWKMIGKKKLHPHYIRLPHKHLYMPTRLESFVEYIDFDVYQKIRQDFLKGRFYFLANNDEYAFMLLFDLMNGYPDDSNDRDFIKLNDELNVLRRLSNTVDKFFHAYINNAEFKSYLKMEKVGLMKEFVDSDVNTFQFPYRHSIKYQPIDKAILPRDHKWTMLDTSSPLAIEREAEPLFPLPETSITKRLSRNATLEEWTQSMPFDKLISLMSIAEWKEYNEERESFLKGNFHDLTYKPSVALHLFYDIQGGQLLDASVTDEEKFANELWALRQCYPWS